MDTTPAGDTLVVELTRDLIRFPTVNPPGNELPAAQYLARRMEEFGLEVELQEIEENRANVIGRIRGEGDRLTGSRPRPTGSRPQPAGSTPGHLVFTGHIDVVPPGGQEWQYPPFGGDLVDGRIYGRGSADMKGGVAAIVAALASLKRAGFRPRADVIAACTYGEEAGMVGAKGMTERRSLEGSRYLVVAEPSDLGVYVGEKGVLWVNVRALGRTAHGSMPHLGINAISYMARLIPRLEEYPFPYQESALLGKPTLSVNVIEGGNKTNVVPDVAEISIDMRTVPGQNHGHMVEQIREIAQSLASEFHSDLVIEVDIVQDQAPLETDRSEPLVDAMVQSVTDVRGAPEVGGVPYGTDAAYLGPGFNMPMVICGPGAAGMAHQPNESVEVEQLVQATQIYADLARRLLS